MQRQTQQMACMCGQVDSRLREVRLGSSWPWHDHTVHWSPISLSAGAVTVPVSSMRRMRCHVMTLFVAWGAANTSQAMSMAPIYAAPDGLITSRPPADVLLHAYSGATCSCHQRLRCVRRSACLEPTKWRIVESPRNSNSSSEFRIGRSSEFGIGESSNIGILNPAASWARLP